MEDAIVTGASGFIGKALLRTLLREGVTVYAIVRKRESLDELAQFANLRIIESELEVFKDLVDKLPKRIDVFYHFAWDGTSGASLGDYSRQIKNIQFTCETIELAAAIQCKKYILAGTINELELFQLFNAEDYLPRKACTYGIAKLSCDLLGKTLAHELNLSYNTAIIGSCFGPGDKSMRIHNTLISHLLKGESPELIEGNSMHDWIYVDEVAEMFYAIGKRSINMKNYYLGHKQLKRFDEIIKEVRDILNPEVELKFGKLKNTFQIDYSLVDRNAVYEDTDYKADVNFKEQILATADWVKRMVE